MEGGGGGGRGEFESGRKLKGALSLSHICTYSSTVYGGDIIQLLRVHVSICIAMEQR